MVRNVEAVQTVTSDIVGYDCDFSEFEEQISFDDMEEN